MWLGPPSMNSQITDLARGAKCVALGAIGLACAPASSASKAVKARAPKPPPALSRKSRLDMGLSKCLFDIEKLVSIQQGMTKGGRTVLPHERRRTGKLVIIRRTTERQPIRPLNPRDQIIAGFLHHTGSKHIRGLDHPLVIQQHER